MDEVYLTYNKIIQPSELCSLTREWEEGSLSEKGHLGAG